MNLEGKKKRKLALWQAYSRLYYKEKVRPSVELQWPARRARLVEEAMADEKAPPKTAPLWFRTEVTKALFEGESQEVKDEAERHRVEEEGDEGDVPSDCDTEDTECAREVRAWAYHR